MSSFSSAEFMSSTQHLLNNLLQESIKRQETQINNMEKQIKQINQHMDILHQQQKQQQQNNYPWYFQSSSQQRHTSPPQFKQTYRSSPPSPLISLSPSSSILQNRTWLTRAEIITALLRLGLSADKLKEITNYKKELAYITGLIF
jgi:septal ring factor EnvC (AmiA/AmiB activator)